MSTTTNIDSGSVGELGGRSVSRAGLIESSGTSSVTTYYYRTSGGVPGSTTVLASIPVGAVRYGERTT